MSNGINRRDALKGIGALAGAALVGPRLAGCGSDAKPGEITNIVVLMMENRSYDHYMGARQLLEGKPGDGLVAGMSNPNKAGDNIGIFPVTMECVGDPPHGWDSSREQLNGGANDGFVRAYQDSEGDDVPPHVMGYLTRDQLPVSYALADAFTHCDRWFSSLLGPTWPNRWYLHSAQSGGYMVNRMIPETVWPTIYDRLNAAKVKWSYYYTDLPFLLTLGVPAGNFHGVGTFFEDAAAGMLPPVSILDPGFAMNDDHPPHHPILGQQFIAAVYDALATSPQWKNSLMVVTYDEHGGFFDHVVPPKAPDDRADQGFDQLGFRVPAMIIGPYVKTSYVSSTVHDHTSVLKHIEKMFSLEPLTMRDAAANDLSDAIDAERLAAGVATIPPMVPSIDVDPNTLDAVCMAPSLVRPTELQTLADEGGVPPELDLRPSAREMMHYINERLKRRR